MQLAVLLPLMTMMTMTSSTTWAPARRRLPPRKQLPRHAAACRWMTWRGQTRTPGAVTAWGQGPPRGPLLTATQTEEAGRWRGSEQARASPSAGEPRGAAEEGSVWLATATTTAMTTAQVLTETMMRTRFGAGRRPPGSQPAGGCKGAGWGRAELVEAELVEAEACPLTHTAMAKWGAAAWLAGQGIDGTTKRRLRRPHRGTRLAGPLPPGVEREPAPAAPVARGLAAWTVLVATLHPSLRPGRTACLPAQVAAGSATLHRREALAAATETSPLTPTSGRLVLVLVLVEGRACPNSRRTTKRTTASAWSAAPAGGSFGLLRLRSMPECVSRCSRRSGASSTAPQRECPRKRWQLARTAAGAEAGAEEDERAGLGGVAHLREVLAVGATRRLVQLLVVPTPRPVRNGRPGDRRATSCARP